MKECIIAQNAPAAIGPYSHAVAMEGIVFVSGQLGVNPDNGALAQGVCAQARQAQFAGFFAHAGDLFSRPSFCAPAGALTLAQDSVILKSGTNRRRKRALLVSRRERDRP